MSITAKQGLRGKAGVGNVIYGKDGVTYFPSVDSEGNLSWTNDGDLENPATVNMKGPQGIQGEQGEPGYTPVKGVDYYTDSDKTELVNAVLAALPDASNVSF